LALASPEIERIELIRRLHEREDARLVAELLIDLESRQWTRSLVIEALRMG
jgi:hypothetical protein